MKNRKNQLLQFLLLIIGSFILSQSGWTCSMYKLTQGDKTIVGCNEDAWRTTPHIWFEKRNGKYGAAFTGSRFDGSNGYAPQSGMNKAGLVFSRLTAHTPKNKIKQTENRERITNPTVYLKEIMHSCATVREVYNYINKYDHSFFTEDVFIYVDKLGEYLVVEPFSMSFGNDPAYVLSNFCPSETSKKDTYKQERYRNGTEFLKNKIDTTFEFYTRLSDTMHVYRNKIGDGTLLTSIWNINTGTVSLYFYHSYDTVVRFNLSEELSKGDHIVAIEPLFPKNNEFEQFKGYQTSQNNPYITSFLITSGCLFLFTSLFFLIALVRRKPVVFSYIRLILFLLGPVLFYYMYVLCTEIYIFYSPAPYSNPYNVFITLTSYLPFVLLIGLIPLVVINVKLFRIKSWSRCSIFLLTLNNSVYVFLIGLFAYWGFYDI
jgi:hypothetical protein